MHYLKGKVIAPRATVGAFEKVTRKSPTLGAKAPKGAKVLFGGKDNGTLDQLKVTDGGLMKGAITKDKFQSFKLHVEFRLPFKPTARGQPGATAACTCSDVTNCRCWIRSGLR